MRVPNRLEVIGRSDASASSCGGTVPVASDLIRSGELLDLHASVGRTVCFQPVRRRSGMVRRNSIVPAAPCGIRASLTTGASQYTGMSRRTYHQFLDFAVHHMGSNLSDDVSQGNAGPDEFRTAPLWASDSGCSSCTMEGRSAGGDSGTREFRIGSQWSDRKV